MSLKIWQGDGYVLPVGIDCDVDKIIFSFILVITCKADTEGTCISWNIHFFCIEVISVDRIHATDRIREFFVDNSVLFTEGNHKFEEFKEITVLFEHAPVEPGDLAVLTVTVVVSEFCISEFIT